MLGPDPEPGALSLVPESDGNAVPDPETPRSVMGIEGITDPEAEARSQFAESEGSTIPEAEVVTAAPGFAGLEVEFAELPVWTELLEMDTEVPAPDAVESALDVGKDLG